MAEVRGVEPRWNRLRRSPNSPELVLERLEEHRGKCDAGCIRAWLPPFSPDAGIKSIGPALTGAVDALTALDTSRPIPRLYSLQQRSDYVRRSRLVETSGDRATAAMDVRLSRGGVAASMFAVPRLGGVVGSVTSICGGGRGNISATYTLAWRKYDHEEQGLHSFYAEQEGHESRLKE